MTSSSRYECPCCGYPTLREQTASAICVLCDWAYGQGDSEAFDEYSLAEARRNFAAYLTFRQPGDLPSFALETNLEVVAAKRSAIAVFEEWRGEPEQVKRDVQWMAVENALHQLQSTRQVEDALTWEEDELVVGALVGLVEDKFLSENVDTVVLSQPQRTILNIDEFNAHVRNGGFYQLFSNSVGDNTQEILLALKEIGAMNSAKLLEQALTVFPDGQAPNNQEERYRFLKNTARRLSKLDKEYFTQAENIYALAAEYCRNHKSAFI